jgi:hypothetical protein
VTRRVVDGQSWRHGILITSEKGVCCEKGVPLGMPRIRACLCGSGPLLLWQACARGRSAGLFMCLELALVASVWDNTPSR